MLIHVPRQVCFDPMRSFLFLTRGRALWGLNFPCTSLLPSDVTLGQIDPVLISWGLLKIIDGRLSTWPQKHSIDLALGMGRNQAPVFCSSHPAKRQKLRWTLTIWFQMVQWCFITRRVKARFLGQAFPALCELTFLPNFCIPLRF